MPDPGNLLDYNRYLYARGNPLKYNDPSGHCAVTNQGGPDPEHDGECWRWAFSIYGGWEHTDYWNKMWPDGKESFLKNVASDPLIGEDYLKPVYLQGAQTEAYQAWEAQRRATTKPGNDGTCTGKDSALCGAFEQIDTHVGEPIKQYCNQNDCVTQSLDVISTAAAVGAAGCVAGVITAPCALPLGAISVAASGSGTVWTAYQVYQGNGDELDLATAGTTLMIGINSTPGVGLVASGYQTYWDFFRPHPSNNQ